MYSCPHCDKVLASAPALRNHIYIHTGEKPWSCDKCPATFRLYSTLYDHKKVSHIPNGKFKCVECPCRFAASLGLRRHVGIYHTKTNLDAISLDAHQDNPLKPSKGRVTVTVVTEDGTKTYPCSYCGKVFYKSQYLRNHYPVHTGERKSVCNLCGVGFKSSSNLLSHKKVSHVDGGRHKCERCPCVFASLLGLVRHRRLLHNIGKAGLIVQSLKRVKLRKPPPSRLYTDKADVGNDDVDGGGDGQDGDGETFECNECGKILASAFGLRNHSYIHKNLKPWQCPDCGISFRLNSTLHGHRKTSHVPNGQFKCDECPCAFAAKFGLRRHKICFHAAQQPILQFNQLKKRKMFPKISQPTNQAKCRHCGLFFKNMTLMNRHLLTHNESDEPDRPYPCSKCDCTYISGRSLRKHEKTAHVPGGKKCPKCSCSFLTNQARKSHHTKMHVKSQLINSLQSPQTRYNRQPSAGNTSQNSSKTIAEADIESPQAYGNLECPTCGKCFNSKPNLRQHLRIHSGQRYECELCHETFTLQSNMIRHQRTCHVEGGPFKCSQCTHCYATTKGFKRHFAQAHAKKFETKMKISHDEMDHRTYHRTSTSPQKATIRQPSKIKFNFQKVGLKNKQVEQPRTVSRTSTPLVRKPQTKLMTKLIAIVSGVSSATDMELVEAVPSTSHSSSGPPICQVCSKRFQSIHSLRAHMSVHTGERRHKCDLCGQNFRQKGDIVSHKKTNHVKDGKYKCAICPCRFISIQGFRRHMMVIHNKNSEQNVVPKFNQIPHKIIKEEPSVKPDHHQKVTLKFANNINPAVVRPIRECRQFSCDLCSAAFNHVQNLTRHRKNSHVADGQFKCSHCTCSFISPTSLRTHEAIFHQLEKKGARKFLKKSPIPRIQQGRDNSGRFMTISEQRRGVPNVMTNGNRKMPYGTYQSKNSKSFSLEHNRYKIERNRYIDYEEEEPDAFEIYNDYEEDDEMDDGYGPESHLEIYNDYDDDDESDGDGESADQQHRQLDDTYDYDWNQSKEESASRRMNSKTNIGRAYPTKSAEELPRGHKQIIFDKDFGDEEECLDIRTLGTAENDPLDTSKDDETTGKGDDFDDDDKYYSNNFRNNSLRMVKREVHHEDEAGDNFSFQASFHESSEESQHQQLVNMDDFEDDRVEANSKQQASSSTAHVFGKTDPRVNGFQKRINRFIPTSSS